MCEQWRHSVGYVKFDGEVFLEDDTPEVRGVLECEIHAENLSKPELKKVPMAIAMERRSTEEYVRGLIESPRYKYFE